MAKTFEIFPVTRVEGHAKVTIHLNDENVPSEAYLHIPELRGFEKFMEGMSITQAPHVSQRICGICPIAHFLASSKAVDMILGVEPTETVLKLRRLLYHAHYIHSHALHLFALAVPDFILGESPESRNIIHLLKEFPELGKKLLNLRSIGQKITLEMTGKAVHPSYYGVGGVGKPLTDEKRDSIQKMANEASETADSIMELGKQMLEKIKEIDFSLPTLHMGLVGDNGVHEIYDGVIRVRSVDNTTFDIDPNKYYEHIGERSLSFSYMKAPILKSGQVYRVGPLSRLNVCSSFSKSSPLSQEMLKDFKSEFGEPAQNVLLQNYARLVETVNSIEMTKELSEDPAITNTDVRQTSLGVQNKVGIGVVEAPRGILIHHYEVDENGFIEKVNLIVATAHNNFAFNQSLLQGAKKVIKDGEIDEQKLNYLETIVRSFDPCFSCSTHLIDTVTLLNQNNEVVKVLKR